MPNLITIILITIAALAAIGFLIYKIAGLALLVIFLILIIGFFLFKFFKSVRVLLVYLLIIFIGIFIYKIFVSMMTKRFMANRVQVATVSSTKVAYSPWEPKLTASGSLRAIQGTNVTTELAGMVKTISFTPGSSVKAGTVLVELNRDSDIALLHSLQANAELAKTTYQRDKAQYAIHAISKATLDADLANLKSLEAQVAQQQATIAKKVITAPFSGRLGINNVNEGQFVNPGDKIVSLQTLDPIYVDFFIPQQSLAQIKVGQSVNVTSDTFPGKVFKGKLTTIDPAVDEATRNVQAEATIENKSEELTPGMFVSIDVITGEPKNFLTLPQTAITYNPYGNIVYRIYEDKSKETKDKNNKTPALTVKQTFVITGETRGDQITILKGLKEGDEVVTSGQLKLKNGSAVAINNTIQPGNEASLSLPDEH